MINQPDLTYSQCHRSIHMIPECLYSYSPAHPCRLLISIWPVSQEHTYDPGVFVQLCSHRPLLTEHSFTSRKILHNNYLYKLFDSHDALHMLKHHV